MSRCAAVRSNLVAAAKSIFVITGMSAVLNMVGHLRGIFACRDGKENDPKIFGEAQARRANENPTRVSPR